MAQHFWLCSGVSCDVRNAIRNPFTDQKKHVFVHARHGWNWMDMVLVSPCKSVHQDSFGDLEDLQGVSIYFRDIQRVVRCATVPLGPTCPVGLMIACAVVIFCGLLLLHFGSSRYGDPTIKVHWVIGCHWGILEITGTWRSLMCDDCPGMRLEWCWEPGTLGPRITAVPECVCCSCRWVRLCRNCNC